MLRLALMFFAVALIAALFGFGGIATTSAEIAQLIFYIFIALFVLALRSIFTEAKCVINISTFD